MTDEKVEFLNPSKRATAELDAQLESTDTEVEDIVVVDEKIAEKVAESKRKRTPPPETVKSEENPVPHVSVDEARAQSPVVRKAIVRSSARILFVTKNRTVCSPDSDYHAIIDGLRQRFLEVHIILLNEREEETLEESIRLFPNAWVYPTNSISWWLMGHDGYRIAKSQMVFGGGFRADIVIADDTYQSGFVASRIAKKFSRPLQLHIKADIFDVAYRSMQPLPMLYDWVTAYVLERAGSARTITEGQRRALIHARSGLEPFAEILPRYYALEGWRSWKPLFNLHERYPQFRFIILHISSMQASSHTGEVLTATAKLLVKYPTIGLVVLGDGPLRATYEKLIIGLGLQKQVEFEPMPPECLSHLMSSEVFLHFSEDNEEDELILMAAVAKVPMIANVKGIAGKLFTDGVSAYLCKPDDIECMVEGINRYLNRNQSRVELANRALQTVLDRVVQDYEGYLDAYALSIERSIVTPS